MGTYIIGIILGVAIVAFSVFSAATNYWIYLDPLSIIIVLGGTLCAGVITYSINEVGLLFKMFMVAFRKTEDQSLDVVATIIEIADKSRTNPDYIGKRMKDVKHPFLRDGLELLIDGFLPEDLEEILYKRVQVRKDRSSAQVNIVKNMGKYPPAFGMMGTVIGLVGLLESIGATNGSAKIGPNMAVALVTTLYGVFIANMIFIPISENLEVRSYKETVLRQIIVDGVLLLKAQESPLMVQEKLNSYLAPSQRRDFLNLGTRERQSAA